jgi:histidinol-phosphate aminotransferase
MTAPPRMHGGPGPRGPVCWDFSVNSHAFGPCPAALAAVQAADPTCYPDPTYAALRERLGALHGVAPQRIVLAASASEFIQRVTAVGARLAPGPVALPRHAYGDYAAAAQACGRPLAVYAEGEAPPPQATLRWHADPGSPLGQDGAAPPDAGVTPAVLDAVYAPLRLAGASRWCAADRDAVFVLHSPNKALGLVGVRGAYAIAPLVDACRWPVDDWCVALAAAAPSWPLGAHALALLSAWTQPSAQRWLASSLPALAEAAAALRADLAALGLQPQASVTPFLCARRPPAASDDWLHARGIAVRDTASFGLPGRLRVAAHTAEARAALRAALAEALHLQPLTEHCQ